MPRYHIAASGKPAPCAAQSDESCPLQGQHFASKDIAEFYLESKNNQEAAKAESSSAPEWVQEVAQEAVAHLEALPMDDQPAWYRTQGRAKVVAAGFALPPLPQGTLDERAELQYRALATDSLLMSEETEEGFAHPGLHLMSEELDGRLLKAETLLHKHQPVNADPTSNLETRRLQAKVAGVRYFREQWAPRFASAESPEEVRSFFMELAGTGRHIGYEEYRSEPGFQEGLKLARGYVEGYLSLV
jgi:hypothetical protein